MFDVGINQLREWLETRRVYDPVDGWSPEVGDMIAVGCAVRPGICCTVYVRTEVFEDETDPDYMPETFERRGFEIWRVVDDGERDDTSCCGYSSDYLKTLEALRQLREAGDLPESSTIRYDVMRFVFGRFQCVGANLDYATARDMVRRFERAGFISFLCESRHV